MTVHPERASARDANASRAVASRFGIRQDIGGGLLLLIGVMLAIGVVAIKIALPIILVVWFVRWLRRPRPPVADILPDAEPGCDGA